MADDVELDSAQTEKLLQFQDLTGIEDMGRCRRVLEVHNWDIEVAVQDTLNMQEGTPSVFSPPSSAAPHVVTHPHDQRTYSVPARQQNPGLLQWGYLIFTFPIRFIFNTFMSILTFAFRLVRPDPIRFVSDPLADVMSFIRNFEAKYGTAHPVFYQGSYSQALNDAKRELKFLLVYLHSEDHQDTSQFCRMTLGFHEVVHFINTNMLFWACSINGPEGYRVSQTLRENGYPFLAVIVLRDNRMTVVARLEGLLKPLDLVTRLRRVMEDNESSLIAARVDRQERTLNQTIRQQQDEAYQESLRADQEKERRKREEQALRALEQQEEENIKLAAERRRLEIVNMKADLRSMIPEEPNPDDPNCIRIVIKLPQGTRLERRFLLKQSLKMLYYFVFCHEQSPSMFQIITNYPRRVLPCQPTEDNPEPPTFADAGLGRSEVVFVQDLEA